MTAISKGLATIKRSLTGGLGRSSDTGRADDEPSPEPAAPPSAGIWERPGQRKIGYLRAMDLFQGLDKADLEWLERVTTMLITEKGRLVYLPGETGEVLFLLKTGRVQIYRLSSDGQKLVITTVGPKTVFGEMSLLGQGMYDSYAEAMEDATICAMSRRDVEQLIGRQPQVALRILELVGQRLVEAESLLEDLAFRSIPGRLASILLRLAVRQEDRIVHMTHQDLAEMAGTYRETVTLHLNQFKAAGWIDLGRRQIVILNTAELRHLAQT